MAADAYPDSSFLVSLHRDDSHQVRARVFLARALSTLAFTPLHRLEVRNALRNAVAFRQMTPGACRTAFRQMEEDLREGLLIHTPVGWVDAFRRADELSEKHASRDGQRAIDLLHVAIALESSMRTFLSFDHRQRKLAHAVGLRVGP